MTKLCYSDYQLSLESVQFCKILLECSVSLVATKLILHKIETKQKAQWQEL